MLKNQQKNLSYIPYTVLTIDITLSSLYEQEMHCHISQHQKHPTKDCKTDGIIPKCQHIEAERTENSRAGHLNVKTILVVDERKVADFVHDQAFETVVEDGNLEMSQ